MRYRLNRLSNRLDPETQPLTAILCYFALVAHAVALVGAISTPVGVVLTSAGLAQESFPPGLGALCLLDVFMLLTSFVKAVCLEDRDAGNNDGVVAGVLFLGPLALPIWLVDTLAADVWPAKPYKRGKP